MNPETRTIKQMVADLDTLCQLLHGERLALRRKGPGKHPGGTVYRVKRHRVRSHWREAHVAVRLNREGGAK